MPLFFYESYILPLSENTNCCMNFFYDYRFVRVYCDRKRLLFSKKNHIKLEKNHINLSFLLKTALLQKIYNACWFFISNFLKKKKKECSYRLVFIKSGNYQHYPIKIISDCLEIYYIQHFINLSHFLKKI